MDKDEIIKAYQRIATILDGSEGVVIPTERNMTEH